MVAEVEARTDEAALRFLCSPTSSCPARTGWPPSSTSAARLVRQAVAVAPQVPQSCPTSTGCRACSGRLPAPRMPRPTAPSGPRTSSPAADDERDA